MSAGDGWHEAADDLELLAQVLERDDVFDEYNGQGLRDLAAKIRDELAFDAGGSRTVAVDFDFCVHGYSKGWHTGDCYDDPVDGCHEGLAALVERGYRVVVFTARDSLSDVREWLAKWDLDQYVSAVTGQKPSAVGYIDDRAVPFDPHDGGWPAALEALDALLEKKRRLRD